MNGHSYTGLYYPFIHFKDERWLKLSALYWDRMARIVPQVYQPADSPTVQELKNGYVQDVPPGIVRPGFGKVFVDFVAKHRDELRKRYGVADRDRWPELPPKQLPSEAGGPSGRDKRLAYVFYEKMEPAFRDALFAAEIAVRDDYNPEWIGMHPLVTRVYMTALADQLSKEQGFSPLTDETLDHVAVGGCTVERLAQVLLPDVELTTTHRSDLEVEGAAAFIAIQNAVPTDIDHLPVQQIMDFRAASGKERAEFQKCLRGFVKDREWLKEIPDAQVLAGRLQQEYDKEIKPKVEDLRTKLKRGGISTVLGVLSVQVTAPALAGAGAALLGSGGNPIVGVAGGVAGAAVALAKVFLDAEKARSDAMASPVAFLLRAEKNLVPQEVAGWYGDWARRFRFV